jgi:hypothetical protein
MKMTHGISCEKDKEICEDTGGEEKDEEEEEEEANILLLHFVQVQKTQAAIHINSNNLMLSKHLQVLGHLISNTRVGNGRRFRQYA